MLASKTIARRPMTIATSNSMLSCERCGELTVKLERVRVALAF
jgi:hypothetical protein